MLYIISALKAYKHNHDLNMTIKTTKSKWTNYFLNIPWTYLVACVFYCHTRIDGLSDYLTI